MAYKENPIKKMESNAQERSNLLNINPLSKHMSTPFSMGGSSSILMGHSPNEMKGSPNHQETDPKDGKKKPTTMQKVRNTLEPGLSKNQTGNSRQQLFDADGDGDTIFNDSNRDGTMLSRGFNTAREYMKRNFPMEGRTTSLTRPYRDFSEGIDTSGDWNDKFKMETGRKKKFGKMD